MFKIVPEHANLPVAVRMSTMKPKKPSTSEKTQLQLFQSRLDSQLNLDHPQIILAELMDWDRCDNPMLARQSIRPVKPRAMPRRDSSVV